MHLTSSSYEVPRLEVFDPEGMQTRRAGVGANCILEGAPSNVFSENIRYSIPE